MVIVWRRNNGQCHVLSCVSINSWFLATIGLIDPKNILELVAFLHSPLGKLLLLVLLIFPMWGAMHRIHHGMHDFKIHIPASGVIFYGLSVLYTVLVCFAVFSL